MGKVMLSKTQLKVLRTRIQRPRPSRIRNGGAEAMTPAEIKRLDTILAKVEALQNQTQDRAAKGRLGLAKDELLRLYNEQPREARKP